MNLLPKEDIVFFDLRNGDPNSQHAEANFWAKRYYEKGYDYFWCSPDGTPYAKAKDHGIFRKQIYIEIEYGYMQPIWSYNKLDICNWTTRTFTGGIIRVESWDYSEYEGIISKSEFEKAKRIAGGVPGYFRRGKKKVYFFAWGTCLGDCQYFPIVENQFHSYFNEKFQIDDDFSYELPTVNTEHKEDVDKIESIGDIYEHFEMLRKKLAEEIRKEREIYGSLEDEDKPKKISQKNNQKLKVDDKPKPISKPKEESIGDRIDKILDDIARVGIDNIPKEDLELLNSLTKNM